MGRRSQRRQAARDNVPDEHDILPEIVPAYIEQAKRMLDDGHAVLLVSKPRLAVMTALAAAFESGYKDRIVFRLTIGSTDQSVLSFWEPSAPSFDERVAALKMLFERGFVTSVSVEPYLSDPRAVVAAVGAVRLGDDLDRADERLPKRTRPEPRCAKAKQTGSRELRENAHGGADERCLR